MNPLTILRDIIAPTQSDTTGTVVGQSGDRVLVRTAKGITPVATDRVCTLGASITMNKNGEVSSVLDNSSVIPEFRV